MIAFVDHTCINQEVMAYTPFKVYNMSSLLELGIRLNNLIPPVYNPDGSLMDFNDERMFDQWYANYLTTNNAAFIEMMNIIYDLYNGINVLILIGHDDYKDIITESFAKFIQQRYGYNSNMLNDYNDWYYMRESSFTIQGIYNLDIDKERFVNMIPINPNEVNVDD